MKQKVLSRAEIKQHLQEKFAGEPEKVINEISYNLTLAGTTFDQLAERMQRAIESYRQKPAVQSSEPRKVRSQHPAGLDVCPICRFEMKTVKLIEDKPAWYCPDHRIVVPHPIDD